MTNISNSIENEWTPIFSPIEEKIVFSMYIPSNDNYDIFIMDFDGNNKINLTNTSSYEKFPQFSPDGSFIIYQGWHKGKMEIFFTNILIKIELISQETLNQMILYPMEILSHLMANLLFLLQKEMVTETFIS